MKELHPYSPEERRKRLARLRARFGKAAIERAKREIKPLVIAKRVAVGIYDDGFIHAGNLAYLALLALFPFMILSAAVARFLGLTEDTQLAVATILRRLPPTVRDVLAGPIDEVLQGRHGSLLWFGAVVGLWTAASFIETIRDILRRAYGVRYSASFWQYRLAAMAIILGSVVLLFGAFAVTVVILRPPICDQGTAIFGSLAGKLGSLPIAPAVTLFATFYIIFLALTPARYRTIECRKWLGVRGDGLVAGNGRAVALGHRSVRRYELTYGSLAGGCRLAVLFRRRPGRCGGRGTQRALVEPGGKALRGEHYEGPFEAELPVEELAPEEKLAVAARQKNKGE
jgi:membrane protein